MKNIYLNNLTGEVIIRRNRLFAYFYFKKIDKHFYDRWYGIYEMESA